MTVRRKAAYIAATLFTLVLALNTRSLALVCIAPPVLELDTLVEGVVEVRAYDYDQDLISIDTISRQMLLQEMVQLYDAKSHCYLGYIDTVIALPIDYPLEQEAMPPIDERPIPPYGRFDMVHVMVTQVLKGEVSKTEFWFVDTVSDIIPLEAIPVPGFGYESYRVLKRKPFVFFGDDPYDLRKSTVTPPGPCLGDPRGYFVVNEDMIQKMPNSAVNVGGYPGIELPLDDFLAAISVVSSGSGAGNALGGRSAGALRFVSDAARSRVSFSAPGHVTLSVYNLRGEMVARAAGDGAAAVALEGQAAGRYVVHAQAGTSRYVRVFHVRK